MVLLPLPAPHQPTTIRPLHSDRTIWALLLCCQLPRTEILSPPLILPIHGAMAPCIVGTLMLLSPPPPPHHHHQVLEEGAAAGVRRARIARSRGREKAAAPSDWSSAWKVRCWEKMLAEQGRGKGNERGWAAASSEAGSREGLGLREKKATRHEGVASTGWKERQKPSSEMEGGL
ncbi:hypothetical protein BHE74_00035407 [Ensete ventricosum]|nr:hypothetical protein BHE74_00035407 [Ensete ventricosum]